MCQLRVEEVYEMRLLHTWDMLYNDAESNGDGTLCGGYGGNGAKKDDIHHAFCTTGSRPEGSE